MSRVAASMIDFFKGHPSKYLLPSEAIAKAYTKVLLEQDYSDYEQDPLNRVPLAYGTDAGNYDVRESIIKWSDEYFRRKNLDPNCLNLTGGASYGVLNILASVTDTRSVTKRAFIVTPTYYLINQSFIDVGFEGKLTAVDETPAGEYSIDVQYLQEQLEKEDGDFKLEQGKEPNIYKDPTSRPDRKLYRYVMYVVPTFSNPGGFVYSLKTRQKLVELARKHDMLIISDDVYDMLDYTEDPTPLPKLCHLDRDSQQHHNVFGNTISNATMSKLVAPGLRFGYQETATPALAKQLAITGANKSGGSPGQLSSFVVKELIDSGEISNIIQRLKTVYKFRGRTLVESVKRFLPPGTKAYGGQGGYFVWIVIPGSFNHKDIVQLLAQHHNVKLASGDNFEVCGDERNWGKNCVRLALSYLNEQEISEGIKIWGDILREKHPELYK